MEKKKIWMQIHEEEQNTQWTVKELMYEFDNRGVDDNDVVSICHEWGIDKYTLTIGRWRVETDEELQKRIDEEERAKLSASQIKAQMLVPFDEYNELVEKAWKYDQLNK